jgi:uncharacterized protein (DUF486 family)
MFDVIAVHQADHAADRLKCLHAHSLVLALALQGGVAFLCDRYQLGLAFVEYCLAVPANRYGNAVYNAAQLKTMQEVITFVVFAGFSFVYLREPITLSQGFGFAVIAAGASFVFHKW